MSPAPKARSHSWEGLAEVEDWLFAFVTFGATLWLAHRLLALLRPVAGKEAI